MSSFSAKSIPLYQIVLQDSASDFYNYGIPTPTDLPQRVYTSIEVAKSVLLEFVKKFEKFIPVAYGDAYPYENTTFEEYLAKNGAAPYGWVYISQEGEEHPLRLGISILALSIH